jgi:NAD(P)-dependent dehydrogenase (short-subunit alcohol dehydrogenase family)
LEGLPSELASGDIYWAAMPEAPLSGKVAIVTGAGRYRGIGRHIALSLARDGADIVVTGSGRPPDTYPADEREMGWRDVESVADEVQALGRRALPLVVDVLKPGDIQRLVEETRSRLGRVDILVNNAAAGRGNDRVPLVKLEESEWRRVIDTNLTGTFLVTKAVGQALIDQGEGGRIINISSIAGRQGMPTFGAYATTKAGIILFTQVLAMEMAPHRINVNCVCPGLIGTYRMEDVTRPGALRDSVMRTIPLGREGEPSEIGDLVAFLAGPGASYIHGQTINIDGGRVML